VVAFAETVRVRGPDGALSDVRVLGPAVRQTSVRVSSQDVPRLGLSPNHVGRHAPNTVGCTLEGPSGTVVLGEGLAAPGRTLWLDPDEARILRVEAGSLVTLVVEGERGRELHDVLVELVRGAHHLLVDASDPLAVEPWALGCTLRRS
jgi:putative phosphotransacetylase